MESLNLISLLGIFVMIALAWIVSSHRTKVNWPLVLKGVLLQAVLAAVLFQSQSWTFDQKIGGPSDVVKAIAAEKITKEQVDDFLVSNGVDVSYSTLMADLKSGDRTQAEIDAALNDVTISRYPQGVLFYGVNSLFAAINRYVEEGTKFVFKSHSSTNEPLLLIGTFAFGILPTVIFFASLMSILYYLGVMQVVIKWMAWCMQKTLGTTGPESMAAAANVLVGHTEAPLVIRPYLPNMTRSELNALMVGGFATISGSLMAIFIAFGISAGHILVASIISAPAALVIAKILQPETETPVDVATIDETPEQLATNVIEAAAIGASDGAKLAINITAMLIAFLALIALANAILFGFGEVAQFLINLGKSGEDIDLNWSLNGLFAICFYPLAWVMGIESGDCAIAGELLGKKVVANEVVAYLDMSAVLNGEVIGANEVPVTISERTKVILTYALCGFSNFGAIGIQIGGIGPLAPSRRSDLAQLGLRAMFGGMLAACMTACMAGVMYGWLS